MIVSNGYATFPQRVSRNFGGTTFAGRSRWVYPKCEISYAFLRVWGVFLGAAIAGLPHVFIIHPESTMSYQPTLSAVNHDRLLIHIINHCWILTFHTLRWTPWVMMSSPGLPHARSNLVRKWMEWKIHQGQWLSWTSACHINSQYFKRDHGEQSGIDHKSEAWQSCQLVYQTTEKDWSRWGMQEPIVTHLWRYFVCVVGW